MSVILLDIKNKCLTMKIHLSLMIRKGVFNWLMVNIDALALPTSANKTIREKIRYSVQFFLTSATGSTCRLEEPFHGLLFLRQMYSEQYVS